MSTQRKKHEFVGNKAYQFRLYPTAEQAVLIHKTFGCVRFIYNKLLAHRNAIYEQYQDDLVALKRQKPKYPADYKAEFEFLKEVDSLALANAQLNLQTAFQNFFTQKTGYPQFKSKHHTRKSYTTNNQKGTIRLIDNTTIRLPKLKDVAIHLHRPIPAQEIIKSATISQNATGAYYIAILVEVIKENESDHNNTDEQALAPRIIHRDKVLGLDYSSKSLYVDSEANSAAYPRFYRKAESKLKKASRKLSKRKKGGSNREKQRRKVAKLHEKVANQRKDFLHKQSRQIANAYDAVVIEDLNMRNMARGLNLAKSTHDNGFGKLKNFLVYKLAAQGKPLVVIDRWFPSSKLCHLCTHKNITLTLSERTWTCENCGTEHDRDINAAINIRNEGCRILGIA